MPTQIQGEAKRPSEKRTVDDALTFGRQQFGMVWPQLSRQFSQPQLIKLAELTLGSRAIHSSQKHGFDTNKLRDASPKVLLAVGWLNLAIAKANGVECECPYTVPMHLPELWQGKDFMKDASGAPLGPVQVFEVFSGLIDLQLDLGRHIGRSDEAEVCKELGRFMRLELAHQEIDWMGEIFVLQEQCPCIYDLLMRKTVPGITIVDQLDKIAALAKMEPDELWDRAIKPYLG